VFIELPGPAQHLSGLGLTLLMLSIGLLIAPSMQHRIAEREEDSQTVLALATLLTRLCFPFRSPWRSISGSCSRSSPAPARHSSRVRHSSQSQSLPSEPKEPISLADKVGLSRRHA
jgi:hypothetical protein